MNSPPAPASFPSVSFRPTAPPDDAFLLRLYASTRAAELAQTGMSVAQAEAFVRQQFQARLRHYQATFPDALQQLILVDSRDAGVLSVSRTTEEIRLVNIELLPDYRGRGIGTSILSQLCQESITAKLPLRLSVHRGNTAAQRLYQRLGFREELPSHPTHISLSWKTPKKGG